MGFDNECILSIQSLPGEYFCPVCRTLIYPNEALQTQCTHLYCKPCLAYVAATTKACPYDGYLVTETDSKVCIFNELKHINLWHSSYNLICNMQLLTESNKSLAETIGKVTVHCLYNKSGCQWQGALSASITHSTACAYGNSPVVCNRCGTQIVHRQVQEHAQLCPVCPSCLQNLLVMSRNVLLLIIFLPVICRAHNLKHIKLMVVKHKHRLQQLKQSPMIHRLPQQALLHLQL
jgi:hypothetical protein